MASPAFAADKAQVLVTNEQGFARLVLSFPGRLDLPAYRLKMENGIIAVQFNDPIDLVLNDIASALPDYVSVAKVDPDGRGVRFGLRTTFNFNPIEAGEKLFIDILPVSWQGLPPSLPPEIVAELAERSKLAAQRAEEERLAREAAIVKPVALMRVGQNPTFLRLEFNWSAPTKATFVQNLQQGELNFAWPVPVNLSALDGLLPPEILTIENVVAPSGSKIHMALAAGVKPRFYAQSDTQYILDIDLGGTAQGSINVDQLIEKVNAEQAAKAAVLEEAGHAAASVEDMFPVEAQVSIKPYVSSLGSTLRVVFPFDQEVPSAVFRRGDVVWMLFDTATLIEQPDDSEAFSKIAESFEITPSGDSQVVRIDLSQDRLATLGSEGKAWVLSLGDILLAASEPLTLNRRLDAAGQYEMTADLDRPGRIHQFLDPVVGDTLTIVTAFPPARGSSRDNDFVDFTSLRSVHGLIVRPEDENVRVSLDSRLAVISTSGGLTVSSMDSVRMLDLGNDDSLRGAYLDLGLDMVVGPAQFEKRQTQLMNDASLATGPALDEARLNLGRFYVANQYGMEAIGVLEVLAHDSKSKDLKREMNLVQAIAQTIAGRPLDALSILNTGTYAEQVDALMWRTMAKVDVADYRGARLDAMASESVVASYPAWVRVKFYLAASRAAVESGDSALAERYMGFVDAEILSPEQQSEYALYVGRLDELAGRYQEALDSYGRVIAADFRPTRAEAVYRTLVTLKTTGKLDLEKASQSLSAETMLWRGNALEADMLTMLAGLYFDKKDYRLGFETVKQAASQYSSSPAVTQLLASAETMFGSLYLDGLADSLDPIDSLAIYYDFQQMTPPGARGDEVIRNLARRLIKVDLLEQAAGLLTYQIDKRLSGVAKAQVAADLAVVQIADRRPELALRVLSETRLSDLSPTLERQRRVLEARALIDAGRDELALDMMTSMSGRDVELMRVDAHWRAKRYDVASELIEVIYTPKNATDPLSQPARMSLIKAAVGFVLTDDQLGLSRLRSKFAERMAQSAEWPMFDYITGKVDVTELEFKKVVRQVSGLDSLNAFLATYQAIYGGDGALTPLTAAKPDGAA